MKLSLSPILLSGWCAWAFAQENTTETAHYCGHGHWKDADGRCGCDEGWSHAGITDTFNFVVGACTQYMCTTDKLCQDLLGISDATCPINNWNCYCGWGYAFENWLTGFEPATGEAKCMGVMYNFFFSLTTLLEYLMRTLWRLFMMIAILLVPFGKKRAICDHERPTIWNVLPRALGYGVVCRGSCVQNQVYTLTSLRDDFAWSAYSFDLMIWMYACTAVLYVLAVVCWSFALWSLVGCGGGGGSPRGSLGRGSTGGIGNTGGR